MTGMSNDIAELAELLHETEQHHGAYEPSAPKHNWWDWYAAYLSAAPARSDTRRGVP